MNVLVLFYPGGVAVNLNDLQIAPHQLRRVHYLFVVLHFNLEINKLVLYINLKAYG